MNKKQKKQLEAAKKRLVKLRQQLAGAKAQMDDPGDVVRLEQSVVAVEEEIQTLKAS